MRCVSPLLMAVLALTTACSGGSGGDSREGSDTEKVDAAGTITMRGSTFRGSGQGDGKCFGGGGYADVREGAPITVYDDSGSVIGTGTITSSAYRSLTGDAICELTLAASGLPDKPFYQLEFGGRPRTTIQRADIGNIQLSISP